MVQFDTIIFGRTFKNYFGQFVWIEKKSHYKVAFHFMKRRLKISRVKTLIVAQKFFFLPSGKRVLHWDCERGQPTVLHASREQIQRNRVPVLFEQGARQVCQPGLYLRTQREAAE